jgi:hypothetical protein
MQTTFKCIILKFFNYLTYLNKLPYDTFRNGATNSKEVNLLVLTVRHTVPNKNNYKSSMKSVACPFFDKNTGFIDHKELKLSLKIKNITSLISWYFIHKS